VGLIEIAPATKHQAHHVELYGDMPVVTDGLEERERLLEWTDRGFVVSS